MFLEIIMPIDFSLKFKTRHNFLKEIFSQASDCITIHHPNIFNGLLIFLFKLWQGSSFETMMTFESNSFRFVTTEYFKKSASRFGKVHILSLMVNQIKFLSFCN